jgi:L-asparaginase
MAKKTAQPGKIKIITTGGTIDKIYFDQKSRYQVGEPQIGVILQESNVVIDYEIVSLMRKDSLDLTDEDRRLIYQTIDVDVCSRFIVTHGTDTMIQTARVLQKLAGKVVLLTGAMQPAIFRQTDAIFNIGCALTAVQLLDPGIYLAMNGKIFDPNTTQKNIELNRFEQINWP